MRFLVRTVLPLVVLCSLIDARDASAYSVLAHEATIDALWDSHLRPLIVRRFPGSSPEDIARARAFAYGGSLIQDMGYYPFGSHFFSDLLHYARSGEFIVALLRDATNAEEYGFALGAVAHYAADTTGHPLAVNRAVPIAFPKLAAKYGDHVTYAQAPRQHILVEFSFDVVQAAGGTYLPESYRSALGFQVAARLLEQAFAETYGLEMKTLFLDEDLAIGTFRYAVGQLFPAITEAAWRDKRDEILKRTPGMEQRGFVFTYTRADHEKEFGNAYHKPGVFARLVAFLYKLVPKIGPLAPLSFKPPTPETEAFFIQSFIRAREMYGSALDGVGSGRNHFPNVNFDTGQPIRYGDYSLADRTYVELLKKLQGRRFANVTAALGTSLLKYFGDRPPNNVPPKQLKDWQKIQPALTSLRSAMNAAERVQKLQIRERSRIFR
jgi:hypothetical protein